MLDQIKNNQVLFLDIETAPEIDSFDKLSEETKNLWEKKAAALKVPDKNACDLYSRAGIYAEFGKVICISAGIILPDRSLRIRSFYGDDEKLLLKDFCEMLNKSYNKAEHLLCAHNGKEFDFPFLARRILINGIRLPKLLDIAGKKPWEVKHLDTLELWKFGDYKHYTSLSLLTSIFKISSSKNDMDGSMVADVYWKEKDLDRIVRYCRKDVEAVVQIYLKFKGEEIINQDQIEIL